MKLPICGATLLFRIFVTKRNIILLTDAPLGSPLCGKKSLFSDESTNDQRNIHLHGIDFLNNISN